MHYHVATSYSHRIWDSSNENHAAPRGFHISTTYLSPTRLLPSLDELKLNGQQWERRQFNFNENMHRLYLFRNIDNEHSDNFMNKNSRPRIKPLQACPVWFRIEKWLEIDNEG